MPSPNFAGTLGSTPRCANAGQSMANSGAKKMMKSGFSDWNCDACTVTPATSRSKLRSANRLMELPACSKSAQNTTENAVSVSSTNIRPRSTAVQRVNENHPTPSTTATPPAMSRPPTTRWYWMSCQVASTPTNAAK